MQNETRCSIAPLGRTKCNNTDKSAIVRSVMPRRGTMSDGARLFATLRCQRRPALHPAFHVRPAFSPRRNVLPRNGASAVGTIGRRYSALESHRVLNLLRRASATRVIVSSSSSALSSTTLPISADRRGGNNSPCKSAPAIPKPGIFPAGP